MLSVVLFELHAYLDYRYQTLDSEIMIEVKVEIFHKYVLYVQYVVDVCFLVGEKCLHQFTG